MTKRRRRAPGVEEGVLDVLGVGSVNASLASVARRASEDADGAPPDLLEGYLEMLVDVSETGRRPSREELDDRRAVGALAAERGVPLRAVIDLYLSATWLVWPLLSGAVRARGIEELRAIGESIFRAADRSIIAATDGYEEAQRLAIRHEEAFRREFVDDLLHGRADLGRLAEHAARFGLRLTGTHIVVVVETDQPSNAVAVNARRLERLLTGRFGADEVLVTTKDDLLVCVTSGGSGSGTDPIIEDVLGGLEASGIEQQRRVAVGRPHDGPGGVSRSFDEARSALDFAQRLGLTERILRASELLVFHVLVRDSAAITELVTAVLGPLQRARGGPGPLLETLWTYFASGGVATEAARRLHLSVRAVSYRLERIAQLTGYSVDNPTQRYTLETATLGARLLGWPVSTG